MDGLAMDLSISHQSDNRYSEANKASDSKAIEYTCRDPYVKAMAILYEFLYRSGIRSFDIEDLAKILEISIDAARDIARKWISIRWATKVKSDRIRILWKNLPHEFIKKCLLRKTGIAYGHRTMEALLYLAQNKISYITSLKWIDRVSKSGKAITFKDLANALGISTDAARNMVYRWCRIGIAKREDVGMYRVEWGRIFIDAMWLLAFTRVKMEQ